MSTRTRKQEQLEQMQALTRDWNQKSRIEQIIIRHQIWNTSDLPNGEYTASWSDVKLLIEEHERLTVAASRVVERLQDLPRFLEKNGTQALADITAECLADLAVAIPAPRATTERG